jgi:hypothetical protein
VLLPSIASIQNFSIVIDCSVGTQFVIVLRAESPAAELLIVPNLHLSVGVGSSRGIQSFQSHHNTVFPTNVLIIFDSEWSASVKNSVTVTIEGDTLGPIDVHNLPANVAVMKKGSGAARDRLEHGRQLLDGGSKDEKSTMDKITLGAIIGGSVLVFLLIVAAIIVGCCSTDKCTLERAAKMEARA